MSYPKIIRNRYRVGETDNRQHASTHHEEDMRDFHLPLAALHQRHLHTWGVCAGLEVSGIVGASTVAVQPGVAIDMEGRMIVLANDGLAQTPEGNLVNVPVTLTLSTLTAGLYYVTFTYGENEQPEPGDTTGRTRPINVRQAPLVRLDAAEGFIENGLALILAVVGVDENHQLSQLSVQHGESGRRLVGQTVHTLAFQRPVTTAEQVTMVPAGNLSALPEGGLQLAVANAVDEIMVSGVDGNSFAALQIHANTTQIQGALTVQRSLHVGGDLQVAGATQLQGPLTVQSALQVSGDLQVAGATRLQGVLAVNTMIAGDLPADLNSAPAKLTITSSGTGDWIFLGQQRAAAGNGGFHVHNPWRDTDGPDRNRLEIAYRTTAGEDLWEQFVLHGPTGNIGIGNGAPTYKLDVNGSLNASELYINGAPLATILPAPSQWTTLENGIAFTEGNVGIRTATPEAPLHLHQSDRVADSGLRITRGSLSTVITLHVARRDYGYLHLGGGTHLRGGNYASTFEGNVGIGVTTPNAKLHVAGGGAIINGVTVGTNMPGLINYPWEHETVGVTALNFNLRLQSPNALIFHSGNAFQERMVVSEGGAVGIGTTNPGGSLHVSTPYGWGLPQLKVTQQTNNDYARIVLDSADHEFHLAVGGPRSSTPNVFHVWSTSSRRNILTVSARNHVGILHENPDHPLHMGGGAYCEGGRIWRNASSITYKADVTALSVDAALKTLPALTPVVYRYKEEDDGIRHVGFIAEEVPDLVAAPDRKGVSAIDIVAILTKVVQHQQQQISELYTQLGTVPTQDYLAMSAPNTSSK